MQNYPMPLWPNAFLKIDLKRIVGRFSTPPGGPPSPDLESRRLQQKLPNF